MICFYFRRARMNLLRSQCNESPDILFRQLPEVFIILPDVAHDTTTIAGTVWHEYDDGQGCYPVRLQAAVTFKGLV